MTTTVFIYGLVCPLENKVMYVGQTVNMKLRMYQHQWEADTDLKINSPKNTWLKKLQDMNLSPSITILDTCTKEESCRREKFWIQYHILLNPELKNGKRTSKRHMELKAGTKGENEWY